MWVYPQPAQAKPNVQESKAAINQVVDSPPDNGRGVLQPQIDVRTSPQTTRKIRSNGKKVEKKVTSTKNATEVRRHNIKTYSKEEVKALIVSYSNQYGINPNTPLCIAYYESGYNQHSKNKRSSASGVFQYLSRTWKGTDEGKTGRSVFDADANVKAAIKYMASRKSTKPWEVRNKCPKVSLTTNT